MHCTSAITMAPRTVGYGIVALSALWWGAAEVAAVPAPVRQLDVRTLTTARADANSAAGVVYPDVVDTPQPTASERIVHGTLATDVPWFASITTFEDMSSDGSASLGTCGGSLVSADWVLTAAHCLVSSSNSNKFIRPALLRGGGEVTPNLQVLLGGTKQTTLLDWGAASLPKSADNVGDNLGQQESRRVVEVHCHPGYNDDLILNDICLLKLDQPSTHTPVQLNFVTPSRSAADVAANDAAGQQTLAYGYGARREEGDVTARLYQTGPDMPLITEAECRKAWAVQLAGDTSAASDPAQLADALDGPDVLCTATANTDTCQGDSGGPLLNAQTGVQIGITSYGSGCASGVPGVYTKVSAYQAWIESVTGGAAQ